MDTQHNQVIISKDSRNQQWVQSPAILLTTCIVLRKLKLVSITEFAQLQESW